MGVVEQIDLNSVEAAGQLSGFELIPDGTYEARFKVDEMGESSGGYPQVTGTWTITEGPEVGKRMRDWVVVSAKGSPFLKARMIALGIKIPGKPASGGVLANYFAREADGKLAQITVGSKPGRDDPTKVFNELRGIAPVVIKGNVPGSADPLDVLEDDVPF